MDGEYDRLVPDYDSYRNRHILIGEEEQLSDGDLIDDGLIVD